MANQQKNNKHGKYIVTSYSIIEVLNEESVDRLFECIPDSWFVDETKTLCFWPPPCGTKSFSLRAINCEKPDDTWGVYECKFVSGGYCKCIYLRVDCVGVLKILFTNFSNIRIWF